MRAFTDITGQTIGRFIVVKFAGRDKHGNARWLCQCSCGTTKELLAYNLSNGNTKSCGCLLREAVSKRMKGQIVSLTHGHSVDGQQSRTYKTWAAMKARCLNPNASGYDYYGGRGITVCESWGVFQSFLADMGERPKGRTLDRIDNNKGYFKENCRWATWSEQMRNRRPRLAAA